MGRVTRKYTEEFKDEAIKLALTTGFPGQTAVRKGGGRSFWKTFVDELWAGKIC